MPAEAVVFTHGHCFDGLASAALFLRLLEHVEGRAIRARVRAAAYGPAENGVPEARLEGAVNAILDYRFTASERLTWYFDHHRTAFATPEDRAAYDARGERRWFWDAARPSCTGLVAEVGEERFGLSAAPVAELVRWADTIDSAAFPSAAWAVECRDPVLRLSQVVEHAGDGAFLSRMAPRLVREPLEAIAASPEIERAFAPLGARLDAFVARVRAAGVMHGRTVLVDLTSDAVDIVSKFAPYALFPECAYSLVVMKQSGRYKISVGYNPWSAHARAHDISAICKRHGGGGHAVVGAVTVGDDLARAREVARQVLGELSEPA